MLIVGPGMNDSAPPRSVFRDAMDEPAGTLTEFGIVAFQEHEIASSGPKRRGFDKGVIAT